MWVLESIMSMCVQLVTPCRSDAGLQAHCGLSQAARALGVDCLVAPYEADAQLAYLNKTGIVQAVITEDSDLLAFGCKKVLDCRCAHMLWGGGSCVCWGAKDLLTWSTCSWHLVSVNCFINWVCFAFVGSANNPRTLYMLDKCLPLSYTSTCECFSV